MTTTLQRRRPITPERFARQEEKFAGYELVDGHLHRKAQGAVSGYLIIHCTHPVNNHIHQRNLGWSFASEAMYQCCPSKPNQVRKPDFSFIRFGRFVDEKLPLGIITIPPDFMIEVISPNESWWDTSIKIEEFLEAGVPLIWIVNAGPRNVMVYRHGGVQLFKADAVIDGDPVFPGWSVAVADLLPPVDSIPDIEAGQK